MKTLRNLMLFIVGLMFLMWVWVFFGGLAAVYLCSCYMWGFCNDLPHTLRKNCLVIADWPLTTNIHTHTQHRRLSSPTQTNSQITNSIVLTLISKTNGQTCIHFCPLSLSRPVFLPLLYPSRMHTQSKRLWTTPRPFSKAAAYETSPIREGVFFQNSF